MSDIALDLDPVSPTYLDLYLVDNDLAMTTTVTQGILQDILQRLRVFYGEWFLDNTIGIPYFTQILIKNPDQASIDALFQNEILGVPGVQALVSYSFRTNFALRTLTISFTAQTTSGVVNYQGQVTV